MPSLRVPAAVGGTLAAMLLLTALAHAQFGTTVTLVEVYATVEDAARRPVARLAREDFVVREDGQPRPIEVFAAGDFPLSVAVAIDRSWSMAGPRLEQAQRAALRFLDELREPDEAMLIGISSEVQTLAPLSRDRAAQREAVERLTPWGTTTLRDAILDALSRIEGARGRRALVVLSDGQDRESRATEREAIDRVRHSDVLVYPVVVSKKNSAMLAQMASFSGGRAFWLREPDEIVDAFASIAQELRQQYLIGYAPGNDRAANAWRRITLEVPGRALRVRARPGYYVR